MVSDFRAQIVHTVSDIKMHLSILSRRIAQDRARDISPNPHHRAASANQDLQTSSSSNNRFTFPSNQNCGKSTVSQNALPVADVNGNDGKSLASQNSRLHSLAAVGIVQSQQESLRENPKESVESIGKKPQFIRIIPPDEDDTEVSELTGFSMSANYLSPSVPGARPLTPILKCPSPSFRQFEAPNEVAHSPAKHELQKRVSFPSELQRYRKPSHTKETEEQQTNRNQIRLIPIRNPFILNGYRQRPITRGETPSKSTDASQEPNQPKDGVKALMENIKKMWQDPKRVGGEEASRSRTRGRAESPVHRAISTGGESSWKTTTKTRPRANTQSSV